MHTDARLHRRLVAWTGGLEVYRLTPPNHNPQPAFFRPHITTHSHYHDIHTPRDCGFEGHGRVVKPMKLILISEENLN